MDWKPWLRRWSEEWITGTDPEGQDPEVVRERWLGYAPAAEADVAAAEERLGLRLPPSYRDFLLTTDGWRHAGVFVREMRNSGTVGWLRDLQPFWEESWADLAPESPEGVEGNPFGRGLLISLQADVGILFLDPADLDANGEWAAYAVFSWQGEPTRYSSFAELMESLYRSFHHIHQPAGETRDNWDRAVERAVGEALSGDIDSAMATFETAEDFGRPRATVLRVQLQMFLAGAGPYAASRLMARLLPRVPVPDGFFTGALFTEEFLPCMFLTHENRESWYASALEIAQDSADRARRDHNAALEIARKHASEGASGYTDHQLAQLLEATGNDRGLEIGSAIDEYRARQPGFRLTFGNDAFDTAVRGALVEHRSDPAALWRALESAMAHWRPRTPDHIAPVALLADPVVAAGLTPERGRALLSRPRGER